ncbi:MAG TPA: dihydropteroate synthase [Candidatus Nanopelagicales bacterium]|nr:dihydropteroate synthase [Candidatus Nanopelagicales bacterium]
MTARHPLGLPEHLAALDRCLVMGVLNVTPDSFSDGGRWLDAEVAVAHGVAMAADGADLVDVGGESTRPGAQRISARTELDRVIPVVEGLVAAGVVVSIDTMRAEVALAAVSAGAALVNDVSGGLSEPAILDAVARLGVPFVAMHWRGYGDRMHEHAVYDDVVADVSDELAARARDAIAAGIDPRCLVLDPGLGFAKDADHNWALLQNLDRLIDLGHPVLVGASRKRFLGSLLAVDGEPRAMDQRDQATDAVSALAAAAGAWCVRVHDVRGTRDAVEVAAAWTTGGAP